jgi:hypothetical protein
MESKFRTSNNQRLLKGLFFETSDNRDYVVYTLKDRDHTVGEVTYPSLYRLYLETEDLTEYQFAVSYLDSWEHWQMLKSCTWFKPYAKRWKEELETKVMSRALSRLKAEAASSSKNAFLANRFLIERGWVPKEDRKAVGRPSKEEIRRQAEGLFIASSEAKDDYERIKDLN